MKSIGEFVKRFFAALLSAFVFRPEPPNEELSRAARRYYGLAFLSLSAVLSTWMWTLDSASYATALDDLLERAIEPPQDDLVHARCWAIVFYLADSVLFIGCYLGFSIVMARLFHKVLNKDLAIDPQGSPNKLVAWASRNFMWVTGILLGVLALSDVIENLVAIFILWPGQPDAQLSWWFVKGHDTKKIFQLALGAWLTAAALTWLLGGSIPKGSSEALREARRARRTARDGVGDVLARTRYCLLIVLAYAVLMLGINQAEDVLSSLAAFLDSEPGVAWTLLGAVALGLFALHTHAHSIWVWVRMLVRLRRSDAPESTADAAGTTFSKWWGRLLGAAPWFIVAVLCVRTAGQARQVGDADISWLLLVAGVLASAWGAGFVLWKETESHHKHRSGKRYYAADTEEQSLLTDRAYRFLGFIRPSPMWIPLVAALGILVIRALYVFFPTTTACNALAAISFSFALWTCVINRLALNSLRSRIPWVLGLVLFIAVMAGWGATKNHGVLAGDNLAITGQGADSLEFMFWKSLWLGGSAGLAYALWTLRVLRKQEKRTRGQPVKESPWFLRISWAAVLLMTAGALFLGSKGQKQESAPQAALPSRPTLEQAVHDWLRDRKNECAGADCRIPVYLVSAEGGGIRAAYYSAQLMSQLTQKMGKQILQKQVFSLSGVSGGSLGVTGWRLCMDADNAPDCVAPLGQVDLLTPLASAWMFEDTLALVLPTGQCNLPGCGFVDRASWFERSLEKSIPGFEKPLPPGPPYLFLNSTWVETGERAIASTIEIETEFCVCLRHEAVTKGTYRKGWFDECHPEFPTARDQLAEIGYNARASTLAHNSARFPYFNPIGYVRDWGHLADGGYFDNSGTQTTADILNEFMRQLTCSGTGCQEEQPEGAIDPGTPGKLSRADYRALSGMVSITALMIRNGVRITTDPADSSCAAPRARGSQTLFSNAGGPLITALNATGIGTPNRVAQCNLQRALTRANAVLPRQRNWGGYLDVRLVSEDTLYPLGWYLSPTAQKGIRTAASECVNGEGLAEELVEPTPDGLRKDCFERVPSGAPPPVSATGRQ